MFCFYSIYGLNFNATSTQWLKGWLRCRIKNCFPKILYQHFARKCIIYVWSRNWSWYNKTSNGQNNCIKFSDISYRDAWDRFVVILITPYEKKDCGQTLYYCWWMQHVLRTLVVSFKTPDRWLHRYHHLGLVLID